MAAGFGARLVQVVEWRAREFQLARRFETDVAVRAGESNHAPAFLDRFPAEFAHLHEDIPDTPVLVVSGCAMVGELVNELLVLGADAPTFGRLLARLHRCHELLAPLDPLFLFGRRTRTHGEAVRRAAGAAPEQIALV